ncbi:MAG TPA: hypothetical protein DD670_01360 [Planctomycetaceae bacterium]|nr:hypothetical protein [Planctomycetaceae bacterium]
MTLQDLSRRGFVKIVGSGAALGVLGARGLPWARAEESAEPGEEPRFRFVQWNDIHIDVTPSRAPRRADEKLKYLIEWLNAPKRASHYDFVLGIGDLIHGGDPESLAADTRRLKQLLGDLKVPLYPALGNHENVGKEGIAAFESPFCEAFGLDRTNYAVRHKGCLFVMLNNSGDPRSKDSEVARRRNDWFRDVLKGSSDTPTFVCCHIPLVPVREKQVLAKSFGFTSSSFFAQDNEMLEIVEEHADSVLAVLSGHLHLTGVVRRKGVHHICLAGMASHPSDFATYDVYADRVRVRVRSLPDRLLTPRLNLHGKPRHKVDFTDAAHATPESYIMGNASERDFELVLPSLDAKPAPGFPSD